MKKPRTKAATPQPPRPAAGAIPHPPVFTVLHIDDDQNDTELFQAAARRAKVQFIVQNVSDAEQAMAYLNGRGRYANRRLHPLPNLVLLDLKMPQATGFDVLRWIRSHLEVGSVPVVIFSGSELQDDIQQAYAGGADSYLVKPIGFDALIDLVKNLNSSWVADQTSRAATLSSGAGSGWQNADAWGGGSGPSEARA
jgi:CheY-like chemotaxis protein